ncbi:aminotransferase class V-fold PLP-dependent enzyme, partial [Sphingomonas solaris]|uniref:aminotransferase class V-fold PLP-dependent enzyme n=1 Tax=Alterirhizorhabdus solaris TaxID=2529389 RepID=UPI001EF06C89
MIYLDYQATTPLAPEARAAMLPWLEEKYGNPHSPHSMGREAAAAVEAARTRVLAALVADSLPGDPVRVEDVALRPDGRWPGGTPATGMLRADGDGPGTATPHAGKDLSAWTGKARPDATPSGARMPAGRLIFTSGATEALN